MSPPAAGTLPCGWNTGEPRSLRRVFKRAEAISNTDKSTVFDVERSIVEIQARPVVVLQVSIHVNFLILLSVFLANNIILRDSKFLQQSCLSLNKELLRSFAMLENLYQITWSYFREDTNLLKRYDFVKKFVQF